MREGMRQMMERIRELGPDERCLVVTLLGDPGLSERALVGAEGVLWQSPGWERCAPPSLAQDVAVLGLSGVFCVGGRQIFVEQPGREKRLVVCGAGHVGVALIRMAKVLGMPVTCIEDRPLFADEAREAGADTVICDDFSSALAGVPGDRDTFFVVLTRGHRWDLDCLRQILRKPYAYLGLMGSRRRVVMVRRALKEEGFSSEAVEGIHAPVGLPIGAESPAEIAVSILAQIIAEKSARRGESEYAAELLAAICGGHGQEPLSGPAVLATIVRRQGSAPRQAGTKMLIRQDGSLVGTIGGGCVESEVRERGLEMLSGEEAGAELLRVDLSADTAADEGMVCGGVLDVLMEVI